MFTCSDCTERRICEPCASDVFYDRDLDERTEEAFAIAAAERSYAASEDRFVRGEN